MKQSIINDIYEIRDTLKSFDKADFHSNSSFYHCSSGFPAGCCGDTTNLLGLFLKQQYDKDTLYISASGLGDNSDQSHAWLLCDGIIIDITADQFNDLGYEVSPVIISEQSHFHTLFDDVVSYALNTSTLRETAVGSVLAKVMSKMSHNVVAL